MWWVWDKEGWMRKYRGVVEFIEGGKEQKIRNRGSVIQDQKYRIRKRDQEQKIRIRSRKSGAETQQVKDQSSQISESEGTVT
jgi:hypothetical protein